MSGRWRSKMMHLRGDSGYRCIREQGQGYPCFCQGIVYNGKGDECKEKDLDCVPEPYPFAFCHCLSVFL